MSNILLHDLRVLTAAPPRNDFYVPVEAHHSIEQVLIDLTELINVRGRGDGSDITLHILAHGGPTGILLGSPSLHQFNVAVFMPLYHKVSSIVFHSCAATLVYPGPNAFHGAHMCRYISQIAECTVIGADATQYLDIDSFYRDSNSVLYAPWQGNVSVYTNGRLTSVNTPTLREAGFMP